MTKVFTGASPQDPKESDSQVLGNRKWGAHLTVEQMRGQLAHEAAGCPAPFKGAVWNGYCYVGGK